MTITNKITIDMAKPGVPPTVHAVQSDANTRVVEATLTANGLPVDLEGYSASVVFRKPDGTPGWYDMMPDGLSAVSIVGNTVTAMLAPQVLAVHGHVIAAIRIELDDDRATTFPFVIAVEADPSAGGEKSENYYNVTTWGGLNNALDNEIYPRLNELYAMLPNAVSTNPQDFNEEQKEIARNNIGAGTASVDNATVGTDAWSSKNIIERLCPVFSESGAEVVCTPMEGYPLSVVSQIDLVQEGSGDPSPDNVRAITGWKNFSVNLVGKDSGMTYTQSAPQVDGFFQEIYGGTYDWSSGVLTVDWVKIQITGGFVSSDGNAMQYIVPQKPFYNAAVASCVCSHYPSFGWTELWTNRDIEGTQGVAMTFSGHNGSLIRLVDNVRFNGDADKANACLAENPIEVAYKLAEPIIYQLPPREILAFAGENTLVSNTGDTTVSGRADLIAHMEKLQQTVEDQAEQIAALQAAAVNNI